MNQPADLSKYSVHELLVSGSRFVDDYDENAAVEHYLQLHPQADEQTVRAERLAVDSLCFRRDDPGLGIGLGEPNGHG